MSWGDVMSRHYAKCFAAILIASLVLMVGPARAGSYDEALAAYYKKDYETALRLYQSLAARGDSRAQQDIARMYMRGEGVPKDPAEALKWLNLSKEQEDALAAYNHGDYETALKVIRPRAEKGQVLAEYILGLMYANGQGVAESYPEAMKWLQKAGEQGEAKAQFSVGVIYSKGLGMPKNDAEAFKWYRRSADQGNATAQFNLAGMYARGQAVPQDIVTAHMFYSLAAAHGIKAAGGAKDKLEKSMSPAQIAESETRAREWKPKSEQN
jgi:uncharacterized protein